MPDARACGRSANARARSPNSEQISRIRVIPEPASDRAMMQRNVHP
jgi:hypothetical protein